MFPLSPSGDINKDLAEEHERDLLEEVQAQKIAKGDKAATDGRNYQPVTDSSDDLVDTHKDNTHVHQKRK
jgi:hypothetical protein